MLQKGRPKVILPLHVQVELTWRCNWRCVHCYQDDHSIERLTTKKLKKLFYQLSQSGCLHVIITGGEPLVRKDIFELLSEIGRYNMSTTLYSNGHMINQHIAEKLSKLVAQVELSLLSGDEQTHDSLSKVKGSFRKVVAAIENLKKENIDIVVKTPLLRPAKSTFKKLERLLDEFQVEWLVDPSISISYAGQRYPLNYQLKDEEIAKFFQEFPRFMPNSSYLLDPGVMNGMCLAGRQFCFIDATGNVYPCLSFKNASKAKNLESDNYSVKMGNILNKDFGEIWNKADIVKAIRRTQRTDFLACEGCSSHNACSPCMAQNYEEHGDIHTTSNGSCKLKKIAMKISSIC